MMSSNLTPLLIAGGGGGECLSYGVFPRDIHAIP